MMSLSYRDSVEQERGWVDSVDLLSKSFAVGFASDI